MIRITGGELRGREVKTPPGARTRPTLAKVRQALFNSIQSSVPDARVLDLFAGSGALGFEALSRGASSVVFVESSRQAVKVLEFNAQTLGVAARVTILCEPLEKLIAREGLAGPFDLVLADPPYELGWETKLLSDAPWGQWLAPDAVVCMEWSPLKSGRRDDPHLPDQVPFLVKTREKNYGDTVLTLFSRREDLDQP